MGNPGGPQWPENRPVRLPPVDSPNGQPFPQTGQPAVAAGNAPIGFGQPCFAPGQQPVVGGVQSPVPDPYANYRSAPLGQQGSSPGFARLTDIPQIAPQDGMPLRRPPKTFTVFSGGMNGGLGTPRRMMDEMEKRGVPRENMILLSNAFPTFVPERPEGLAPLAQPPQTPLEFADGARREVLGRGYQALGTPVNVTRNVGRYASTQFDQSAINQSTNEEVMRQLQQAGWQPGDQVGFVGHSAGAMRLRSAANQLNDQYGIEPAFFASFGSPMIEPDLTPFNGRDGQHLPEATRHVAMVSPNDPVTAKLPGVVPGVHGEPQWLDDNDLMMRLNEYRDPSGRLMQLDQFGHCAYDAHGPAMDFLANLIQHPDGRIPIGAGLTPVPSPQPRPQFMASGPSGRMVR